MTELIAQNSLLKLALLAGLFALVAAISYVIASAFGTRQLTRQRLVGDASRGGAVGDPAGSLRPRDNASAWVRLVNAGEKSGLPLIDTKDHQLRQRLIASDSRIKPMYCAASISPVTHSAHLPVWMMRFLISNGASTTSPLSRILSEVISLAAEAGSFSAYACP